MMRQTLLAMLVSMSTLVSLVFCLAGFVPQDEGPEIRRFVRNAVVTLAASDMPMQIEVWRDTEHLWAYRGSVVHKSPSWQEKQAKGLARFSEEEMILSTNADPLVFCYEPAEITIPLLAQDGISLPALVGFVPLVYADICDTLGQPVRWYANESLEKGYTPLALKRPFIAEEESPRLASKDKKGVRAQKAMHTASKDTERAKSPRVVIRVTGTGFLRADAFQPLVRTYARKFGLEIALVNAIIYSESTFRQHLVSKKSAVGLMQVLPKTASVDISRHLHGRTKGIDADTLFDAETNIHYGTCYLSLLQNRYFVGVTNRQTREYCVIASYNMGPKRVYQIFGQTMEEAWAKLNTMSSEEVYQTLMERLPREETKGYLAKVRRAKEQYVALGLK
ncbi:MAG: transglycosylase SLT domain-containing protein [Desulfovibrio sp.]|nr:transglycosylase SLT domain-containing protein [Desulfovibrio sp.]